MRIDLWNYLKTSIGTVTIQEPEKKKGRNYDVELTYFILKGWITEHEDPYDNLPFIIQISTQLSNVHFKKPQLGLPYNSWIKPVRGKQNLFLPCKMPQDVDYFGKQQCSRTWKNVVLYILNAFYDFCQYPYVTHYVPSSQM